MKIVGVAACAAGIAHTYIAKEKLVRAAESAGHEVYVETQGTIGIRDRLIEKDIADADIVVIAADIKINGMDRFDGKKVVEVPTDTVIKSPKKFIEKIESIVEK